MSACVETARHLIDAQFPERLNWFPHIASAHRLTETPKHLPRLPCRFLLSLAREILGPWNCCIIPLGYFTGLLSQFLLFSRHNPACCGGQASTRKPGSNPHRPAPG